MKFKKYKVMDCMGEWFDSDFNSSYIDLENMIYKEDVEEPIEKYKEIYSDISKDNKAFRFYLITLKDKTELFIKVREEWVKD